MESRGKQAGLSRFETKVTGVVNNGDIWDHSSNKLAYKVLPLLLAGACSHLSIYFLGNLN